jgi:hypothetical protein
MKITTYGFDLAKQVFLLAHLQRHLTSSSCVTLVYSVR